MSCFDHLYCVLSKDFSFHIKSKESKYTDNKTKIDLTKLNMAWPALGPQYEYAPSTAL